jgi:hypothetical protein
MVFARRRSRIHQAIVEIGEASSGFLQLVAMVFRGGQRSQLVCRYCDPLLAFAAPNAEPAHTRLPGTVRSRDALSQHSSRWDERSSPGEPIHPGDLASIASITGGEGERDLAIAVMAPRKEAPENRGATIRSIRTMAA